MAPDSGVAPSSRLGSRTRLTLHLGVLDQPYRALTWNPQNKRRVKGAALPMTTGDVASILEKKYEIMETFYRVKERMIGQAIENSLSGALESLLMGRAVNPWGAATQVIEREFRQFISSKEAERVGIPGTPTKAAMRGVNHRLKHPYAKHNRRRPSFRDTGLYMASFRSWVD